MDMWGSGCQEHRAEIIAWLKEATQHVSWSEIFHAARALLGQEWFRPLSPLESLLDEALRRAAAKQ